MRGLDAKLAEALGYEVIMYEFCGVQDPQIVVSESEETDLPNLYTGNGMLWLIDEMLERGWKIMTIYSYGEYTVYFENSQAGIKVTAEHKKLVTAVALAAYKSLTGKGWTDE